MKKRALSVFMAALLLFSLLPAYTALAVSAPTGITFAKSNSAGLIITANLPSGIKLGDCFIAELYDSRGTLVVDDYIYWEVDSEAMAKRQINANLAYFLSWIEEGGSYIIKSYLASGDLRSDKASWTAYTKTLTLNVTYDKNPVSVSKAISVAYYSNDSDTLEDAEFTGKFDKSAVYLCQLGVELEGVFYVVDHTLAIPKSASSLAIAECNSDSEYDSNCATVQKISGISVTNATSAKLTLTAPQSNGIALSSPSTPERQEKATGTAKVGSFTLNMRLYPTSLGPVYALKNGTQVKYFEKSGAWVRIETAAGDEGWVAASYLCFSPYTMKVGDQAKVFSGSLILRKEASSSSESLKTLKNGNTVKILDNTTSKAWVKVDFGGTVGWVAASYIGKGI